jgi:HSP20 family protein
MLYDPFKSVFPKRGFGSFFFGPSIRRHLESDEFFITPKVDVSEADEFFTVKAELPGFDKEEIKLEVEDGRLSLRAEHNEEKEEEKENYHVRERRSGTFVRTFSLPDNVDGEHIEANMENGVLTVTIPKTEAAKPKQIEVKIH